MLNNMHFYDDDLRQLQYALSMPHSIDADFGSNEQNRNEKKHPTYIHNVLQYMARLTYIKF